MRIFISILLIVSTSAIVGAQSIPFSSDRWEIKARENRVEQYLGRDALKLKGGQAIVKNSKFENGTIEFDIAFSEARGFMGGAWRWQDAGNYEEFYMRPHQSGLPDANQYQPVFNGVAGWQLYHGADYGTPIKYDFNKWMPVKIVVAGNNAEIYIKDLNKPLLFVNELKHGIKSGKVGLIASNFAPAWFSNFRFTPGGSPKLIGKPRVYEAEAPGTITSWKISSPFEAKEIAVMKELPAYVEKVYTLKKMPIEVGGFVNIARSHGIADGKDTVFAVVNINSGKDQIKKFSFGYSDNARVYLEARLIYEGTNRYQSRDYRYLGSIGLFDSVYLPLKKGKNELAIAITEGFGGWGVMGMFEDTSGVTFNP
jgi:hypothetical protein